MRVGVAGVPGAWSTERLRLALAARGVDAVAFSLAECTLDLPTGGVLWEGRDLGELDAVVVKKLGDSIDPLIPARVHLLRHLEFRGVRVFSRAEAIAEVNDRYRMTVRLAQAGIPVPPTVVTENLDDAAAAVERFGRAVVKPLFTSKGRGMYLLARDQVHRLKLREWQRRWHMPFYVQEYVPHTGRDIGVTMLAGRVLGAYYRVGRCDAWLTTTAAGGRYEPCPVTPEIERLAVRASGLFGLDFTGVDLVDVPGGYLVYEVSAFGGFSGLWRAQGVDAADLYAEYVIGRLEGGEAYERTDHRSAALPA
jgi:ribosomal protein S6--L-glutamate ligase